MKKKSKPRENRVRELRDKLGWTQEELAKKINVKKETISKIELRTQSMTAAQALALSQAFGMRIDDLYEGAGMISATEDEVCSFTPNPNSPAHLPLQTKQYWYRIAKTYLDQLGYMVGDELRVDIGRKEPDSLKVGNVVIAKNRVGSLILREFIPPSLLITNSLRHNLPILNLYADNISVIGAVDLTYRPSK
jgi:putative transcriptional regulator